MKKPILVPMDMSKIPLSELSNFCYKSNTELVIKRNKGDYDFYLKIGDDDNGVLPNMF